MRGVWRLRRAAAWLDRVREWIADEFSRWTGYTQDDIRSLKHKISTSLPGAVVWLTDGEINALRTVKWPDELGILAWCHGTYKVVRSPYSGQRGVIFPPKEVILG